ncbi:hypothetical protein B0H13DRAFT_1870271 [Mycena leptocephala]|nr:hypothetical protein B0H13DRAFT_1870271 [Mycena leptocephala]
MIVKTRSRHPLLNSWTIHRATTLLAAGRGCGGNQSEVQDSIGTACVLYRNLRVPFRFRNPWYGRVATRTGVIAPGLPYVQLPASEISFEHDIQVIKARVQFKLSRD